jgi:hypothetical protein
MLKLSRKVLGAVVDGHEAAGHEAGDRAGDQDPTSIARPHALPELVDQAYRAVDVQCDDPPRQRQVLVEESAAKSDPGVGEKCLDRTVTDRGCQLCHAVLGREVRLYGRDHGALCAEPLPRRLDLVGIGADQKLISIPCATSGEFKPDA